MTRKMDSVLQSESFVDWNALEIPRDGETHHVGNHQGHNDGVIARQFEDHKHRCERGSYDPGEQGSHSYQRIGSGIRRYARQESMGQTSDASPAHRAEEQARSENPPCIARAVTRCACNRLQHQERDNESKSEITIENLSNIVVTDAEHRGTPQTE